jgi:hypothetical protein
MNHEPQIYRVLGTPNAQLLGEIRADVADVKETTAATEAALAPLAAGLDQANGVLSLLQSRIGVPAQDLVTDLTNAVNDAADRIVQRIQPAIAPLPITLDAASAPLVRLLLQAQAIVLDKTPDDASGVVGMEQLAKAASRAAKAFTTDQGDLRTRYLAAFADIHPTDDRSSRFNAMDALIHDIAASVSVGSVA